MKLINIKPNTVKVTKKIIEIKMQKKELLFYFLYFSEYTKVPVPIRAINAAAKK